MKTKYSVLSFVAFFSVASAHADSVKIFFGMEGDCKSPAWRESQCREEFAAKCDQKYGPKVRERLAQAVSANPELDPTKLSAVGIADDFSYVIDGGSDCSESGFCRNHPDIHVSGIQCAIKVKNDNAGYRLAELETPKVRRVTRDAPDACASILNEIKSRKSVIYAQANRTESGILLPPSKCWVEYVELTQ